MTFELEGTSNVQYLELRKINKDNKDNDIFCV